MITSRPSSLLPKANGPKTANSPESEARLKEYLRREIGSTNAVPEAEVIDLKSDGDNKPAAKPVAKASTLSRIPPFLIAANESHALA